MKINTNWIPRVKKELPKAAFMNIHALEMKETIQKQRGNCLKKYIT